MIASQTSTEIGIRSFTWLFNINTGDTFKSITQSITLTGNGDFVHIYIYPTSKVAKTNEKSNYARVPLFKKEITTYVDVNTSYPLVDDKIRESISQYVKTTNDPNSAQVSIVVGTKSPQFQRRWQFTASPILKNTYYYYYGVQYNFKSLSQRGLPYVAIVGGYKDLWDGKNYILTFGSDIDGDIAAVKKLISARDLFLSKDLLLYKRNKVIDDFDLTGISVADLLRNQNNKPYYNQRGSNAFADIVSKILNNNNFQISIKTVKTFNDNTTLRLKNINSDFSANFTDAVVGNSRPVVLAGGLWGNLLSWNEFGKRLAFDRDYARGTWLIEITGGPEQDDKPTSPNYRYIDLVDYYWSALITGVQNYSGQKILDYVGFSNGCRVGLDSLRNWTNGKNNSGYVFDSVTGLYITSNLGSNPVNTFIGVGCPGAFQGESAFSEIFGEHGDDILNFFTNRGITHVSGRQLGERLAEQCGSFINFKCHAAARAIQRLGENRISRNLGSDYLNFITQTNDNQPGQGLQLQKILIIHGEHPSRLEDNSDGVVTREDAEGILVAVTATVENISQIDGVDHSDLVNDQRTEDLIRGYLR